MKDVRYIADQLDSKFKLPNGWRIGWDGILGLIPGLGNLITDSFSFYILFRAAMLGCPPAVLLRMALNVLIDNVVDKVPLLGFIFDFIWKANTKNVDLMDAYFQQPHEIGRRSKWILMISLAGLFLLFCICVGLSVYAFIWVITTLYRHIPG